MNPTCSLALLACLCLPACTSAVASGADDATPSSPAPAGDWSCLSPAGDARLTLAVAQVPSAAVPDGSLRVHLREAYSNADVGGVTVTACALFDETCDSNLSQTQADELGVATLPAWASSRVFDGYLKITGPGMVDNYVFFAGRVASGAGPIDVTVYTPVALGITATLAGVSLDPSTGVVRADAVDCSGVAAEGVKLSIEGEQPAAWTGYFDGDGAALSSAATSTDATGIALAFGVSPGVVGAASSMAGVPAGGAIGFARAGSVSSLVVRP